MERSSQNSPVPKKMNYKIQSTKYEILLSLLMSALKFWICWMKERGPSGVSHMWIMLWCQVTFYNIIKHKICTKYKIQLKYTKSSFIQASLCTFTFVLLRCWKPCSGLHLVKSDPVHWATSKEVWATFEEVECSRTWRCAEEVYGWDIPCKVGSTDFHIVTNLWQTR